MAAYFINPQKQLIMKTTLFLIALLIIIGLLDSCQPDPERSQVTDQNIRFEKPKEEVKIAPKEQTYYVHMPHTDNFECAFYSIDSTFNVYRFYNKDSILIWEAAKGRDDYIIIERKFD